MSCLCKNWERKLRKKLLLFQKSHMNFQKVLRPMWLPMFYINFSFFFRYDSRVRPVMNHSKPTTVSFSMSLYQILSIVSWYLRIYLQLEISRTKSSKTWISTCGQFKNGMTIFWVGIRIFTEWLTPQFCHLTLFGYQTLICIIGL